MKYLIILALAVTLIFPDITSAQTPLVPCGYDGVEPCNLCHFVDLSNNIIVWLIGVLMVVFAIMAVVAGFGLVTSGGNPSAKEAAKSKFTNAIIGLVVVLAGWLIVDTVMRTLLSGGNGQISGFGPWMQIECVAQPVPSAAPPPATPTTPGTPTTPTGSTTPSATADGSFTYQAGIQSQAVHASPKLNDMLRCMANIVPGNVGEISSISDSRITSGQQTWSQCRLSSRPCAHVPSSYHYGNNGRCGDMSYAVDFGDEQNVGVLCDAARACGAVRDCSVHNGNHVHLEIPCP